MRGPLPALLLILIAGGLLWFVFREETAPENAPGELVAPEEVAEGGVPPVPMVAELKTTVAVTLVEEIPVGAEALLEATGESPLDDPEVLREVIVFDVDPRAPRLLRGEDLLQGLNSLSVVKGEIKFLRREDLKKFRNHIFDVAVEPRVDAGALISRIPLLGFRAVSWEGDVYLIPHNGFREESSPAALEAIRSGALRPDGSPAVPEPEPAKEGR